MKILFNSEIIKKNIGVYIYTQMLDAALSKKIFFPFAT